MTYLHEWRRDQREADTLPAEVRGFLWMQSLTLDDVLPDRAAHLTRDEINLMRLRKRAS